MVTTTALECAAIKTKSLFHCGGILTPGMWPCGWHATTNVVILFHPTAIFCSGPFAIHLKKQKCSPFSFCENMPFQKYQSLERLLWLPQHVVSDPRSKKKNTGHCVYDSRDNALLRSMSLKKSYLWQDRKVTSSCNLSIRQTKNI